MAASLEKSKKLNELNKPLHPSTNPEILVKIGPLGSELQGSRKSTIKTKCKKNKQRQNIGKIHSPFGKFAEWAKLNNRSSRNKILYSVPFSKCYATAVCAVLTCLS